MSITEILAEVDRLIDADRTELMPRLRARELADDQQRTAEASARLDRALQGQGAIGEEEVRRRLRERGLAVG